MMKFMRLHWFDLGAGLAVAATLYTFSRPLSPFSLLLWLNLIALFLHQFEEYRLPGTFPGMLNTVMFASSQPDRYPLNTNTALIVNVFVGWTVYLLAAALGEQAAWLGIAAMLVSLGNVLAHTLLFNIRGKTLYNPGMLSAVVLFAPLVAGFAVAVVQSEQATAPQWLIGIILGLALNTFGVFGLIHLLKDEQTAHIFPSRSLSPQPKPHVK